LTVLFWEQCSALPATADFFPNSQCLLWVSIPPNRLLLADSSRLPGVKTNGRFTSHTSRSVRLSYNDGY